MSPFADSPTDRRSLASVRSRLAGIGRFQAAAILVAVAAGTAVFAIAATIFAYHSTNHDEAVYLLQAAMLLDGQLELYAGDLAGAVRPWFFVEDGGRLYPKYTPVPAAMYAVSMALFGEPRVTLAVVAAGNTLLVYLLGAGTFDRRVGVVAAVLFAASPLALVTTATFLPYAPTTFLNLLFAVAYLRSVRERSTVAAVVAGVAIGTAFFARPFTAVLFAAPFVLHALFRVVTSLRANGLTLADPVRRHALTAAFGTAFVGLTLAYNFRLTGAPLTFPYEAFAPLDGPGFGRRQILDHSIDYTPALALRANGHALWYFATRWFTAGPVGTALAVAGVALASRRWFADRHSPDAAGVTAEAPPRSGVAAGFSATDRTAGLLLAGLFVTVPAGNVFFWGTHNALATLSDPTDGLVSQFGPFYHFDLLVPLSVFAGLAVVAGWETLPRVRSRLATRLTDRTARILVVTALAACLLAGGVAAATAVATPLDRNAAYADMYETAYEPVEETTFDDALVFVPTPYGDWQNHPFQYLRNDPDFDGDVVYALDRGPGDDFAVLDAYPDRTYYRYAYQGEWTPNAYRHVTPKLEPVDVRRGQTLAAETTVGVPDNVDQARVRLETGGDHAAYALENPDESVAVEWSLDDDAARLDEAPDAPVALAAEDVVVVTVTLVQPDGSTLTYRQEATVRTESGEVEVVWPPERSVCPLVTDCGTEGTYLPDEPDAHPDGVAFETTIESAT